MELNQDTATQKLACENIKKQLKTLTKRLEGAKFAREIEDVHKVRVASRRLRAILRLFGDVYGQDKADSWQKQLKKLLKGMSEARDLDAEIMFIEGVLSEIDYNSRRQIPGIRRALLRKQQARQKMQPKVAKAIKRFEEKNILIDMHLETERILFPIRNRETAKISEPLLERLRERIEPHKNDVLKKLSLLKDIQNSEGHHKLRIAVKKTRYCLEAADKAFEGSLSNTISKVKKFQTLLGDMHDRDVWKAGLENLINDEKERTIEYFGSAKPFPRLLAGMQTLKDKIESQRLQLYQQASEYAAVEVNEHFWNNIDEPFKNSAAESTPET
ncbi:hypothetical protein L21SP3_00690 [Sedimentisphaera cyanobacteriorum]|uniref:CHAD domain-containing protein n=1 Tax=Sedimentisphaera cyanobacteriorum TaxID=1940790 RepID=A0A1Q2HN39_9BACT|nr:CHAD domain-containing protein [Sedimentisphaera cyanobacteriorum]AQQ08897.1 hypothetical protein L21SP3_00690 [Sedimentisphaera cyanobacteriorum]